MCFFLTLIGFIFVYNTTTIHAGDVAGKIITKTEADTQFGPVLNSVNVSSGQVTDWLSKSSSYIMFSIINNQLYVVDNNRVVIFPSGATVQPSEIFHVYSISKVSELISLGGGGTINFEVRENVFSLTIGNYTLEFGTFCPPYCN